MSGGTNTASAIHLAVNEVFKSKTGARKGVKNIIVVITDGESFSESETKKSASQARHMGINLFAIGVGTSVNVKELRLIAGSSEHVYQVSNYEDLKSIKDALINKTCIEIHQSAYTTNLEENTPLDDTVDMKKIHQSTNTTDLEKDKTLNWTVDFEKIHQSKNNTDLEKDKALIGTLNFEKIHQTTNTSSIEDTPQNETVDFEKIHQSTTTQILQEDTPINKTVEIEYCSGKPADVLFLLDSSSSISRNDFKKQLSFIKSVVNVFDINPQKTAVGVSTFSDDFRSVIHLNEFTSKESIFKAVDKVPYLRGGTDTGNALKNIIDFDFKFARPNVAHILIIITDGLSRDPFETFLQASKLKKTGVSIFAIGVGPFVDQKELKTMASPPKEGLDFVFNFSTYDALHSIKNLLAIKTCVIAGLHMKDRPICILNKPVDIVFTFNAATIGNRGTRSILKTVQNFEKLRFQNESDMRVGVISQSCAYGGDLPLQTPNKNLAVTFDKMSFLIKRTKSYGLTEENGARSEAVHIVVLIVDTLLTMEDEIEILELEAIVNKMYIAYVGNIHNKNSILSVSSASVTTLSLVDFTAIESLSGYLQEEICQMVQIN
ncbi:collagen alpha-6(VI) chain-like isoform X1 [Saccostrea cucullata]|uniref:collagen alpha-6(VI) chain-like isoform X1 n=1 Tax=Saccostrea cuccullata TaxID=36930 RepID=UPI002ED2A5B3